LFDQAGRLYKSGNIVSEHQIISLENFSKGVYIIKVLHEGYVSVEKLILK